LPAGRSRDRDRFSHGSDVPYDYISHFMFSLTPSFHVFILVFLNNRFGFNVFDFSTQ